MPWQGASGVPGPAGEPSGAANNALAGKPALSEAEGPPMAPGETGYTGTREGSEGLITMQSAEWAENSKQQTTNGNDQGNGTPR